VGAPICTVVAAVDADEDPLLLDPFLVTANPAAPAAAAPASTIHNHL
jgi:hypothetical protein